MKFASIVNKANSGVCFV